MTEQTKAEAYVRSQRPALMQLSFGCEVELQVEPFQPNNFVLTPRGTYVIAGYFDVKATVLGEYKIIGHQPELQDWLAVLGKYGFKIVYGAPDLLSFMPREGNSNIHFELSTGQPARESEYKAFNDIVGVWHH